MQWNTISQVWFIKITMWWTTIFYHLPMFFFWRTQHAIYMYERCNSYMHYLKCYLQSLTFEWIDRLTDGLTDMQAGRQTDRQMHLNFMALIIWTVSIISKNKWNINSFMHSDKLISFQVYKKICINIPADHTFSQMYTLIYLTFYHAAKPLLMNSNLIIIQLSAGVHVRMSIFFISRMARTNTHR